MRKIMIGMAAAVGLWSATPAAVSVEDFKLLNGQDLLDVCTVVETDPLYQQAMAFCYGYVTGVMHYHRALAQGPKHERVVCPGREVPRVEAIGVFIDWARQNPQHLNEAPIDVLARAAVAKWPCEPKKS
jgi:hypothetical protein